LHLWGFIVSFFFTAFCIGFGWRLITVSALEAISFSTVSSLHSGLRSSLAAQHRAAESTGELDLLIGYILLLALASGIHQHHQHNIALYQPSLGSPVIF